MSDIELRLITLVAAASALALAAVTAGLWWSRAEAVRKYPIARRYRFYRVIAILSPSAYTTHQIAHATDALDWANSAIWYLITVLVITIVITGVKSKGD